MEEHSIDNNIPSSFKLMREFFNWSYENPEIVTPNLTAVYMFILDHHSRLGFKDKFGLPTMMTMEAIGIKNYRTYRKALDILVEFKFIQVVEWSKNQYSSNVVAVVKNTKANTKALTKASTKHVQKQVQRIASIDKLKNLRTKEYINDEFEIIWANYGKVGSKKKALEIWEKMDNDKRDKIALSIPGYKNHLTKTGYAPKHFTTYLNSDEYENYLNISTSTGGEIKVERIKVLPSASNNFEFSLLEKLKGLKNVRELYEFFRTNRPECSEVFQTVYKFQGEEMDKFLGLPETHKLRMFVRHYSEFCEYERN